VAKAEWPRIEPTRNRTSRPGRRLPDRLLMRQLKAIAGADIRKAVKWNGLEITEEDNPDGASVTADWLRMPATLRLHSRTGYAWTRCARRSLTYLEAIAITGQRLGSSRTIGRGADRRSSSPSLPPLRLGTQRMPSSLSP